VTMKNDVFWYVTSCGSYKNRVSEELTASFISVARIVELGTTLAVTTNRSTLRRNTMMKAIRSSETSIINRATQHNGIFRGRICFAVFVVVAMGNTVINVVNPHI
jgi:hypothetical protein